LTDDSDALNGTDLLWRDHGSSPPARFRRDFPGLDIVWLERVFGDWVADHKPPDDDAAVFSGFNNRKKG
jgi:hypothetical protein